MTKSLLIVTNLQVAVDNKTVIEPLDWEIGEGEVVALVGPNGGGKSSLAQALMGDYRYQTLEDSKVQFGGKDLLKMTPDESVRAGLFVAWQNPVIIPGVAVFNLCKASYESLGHKIVQLTKFKQQLEDLAEKVGLPKEYITRNVNEGFSGGEKKRLELLQLLLIKPKLAILDEIDSGLDASGIKIVVEIVNQMKREGTAFILITHNKKLLDEIAVDKVCEMKHGRLSTGV